MCLLKRRICAIVFLLSLALLSGSLAEESFFEESFLEAAPAEESVFDEIFFPGEEFFSIDFPAAEEEGEGAAEAEARSVLFLAPEATDSETYDWQKQPTEFAAVSAKANTVTLTWKPAVQKLPKNVKYYVYEKNSDGTGTQVGTANKGTLTLKNVPGGSHTYFVRAEYGNAKLERELYGVASDSQTIAVASELWKKAPQVTCERTGESRVTLHWEHDAGATAYEVTVWHGKELYTTRKNIKTGTYTDTAAVPGKNVYQVRAISGTAYGKATKKTVTLPQEAWMTAPVVKAATQLNETDVKISFFHVSPAASYLISVGGKTQTVSLSDLSFDGAAQVFTCQVQGILKGAGKKKVTVQPLGTNGKKTVKGTKSAALTLTALKDTLLGAVDVQASADGNRVTVTLKNANSARLSKSNLRVYLINTATGAYKSYKRNLTAGLTEGSVSISNVGNGHYKVFVRILTEDDDRDDLTDTYLRDVVNLEMPEVTVTGIEKANLALSLNRSALTLYEQTSTTAALTASWTGTKPSSSSVAWSSSDPSVASVSSAGKVTAVSGGTCYITARAKVTVDGLTAYGEPVSCKVTVNPAVYRAVVIGQKLPHWNGYYDWYGRFHKTTYDAGTRFNNDRLYMEKMLKGVGYTTVNSAVDISKDKTWELIKKTFADADRNDVSLVFFSCHGVTEEDEWVYLSDYGFYYYSGDLCFTNGEYMTPMELAYGLDSCIPAGRVAVFLGSCGSGASIETNGIASRGESESQPWGQAFIDAIAALDTAPAEDDEADGGEDDAQSRYAEFQLYADGSAKTYYVMTAAEKHQNSSGTGDGSAHSHNYFATWVGESAGYLRGGIYEDVPNMPGYIRYRKGSAASGSFSSSIPGDSNGDKRVSFAECFSYVKNERTNSTLGKMITAGNIETGTVTDTPLSYASGGDFPLFRR